MGKQNETAVVDKKKKKDKKSKKTKIKIDVTDLNNETLEFLLLDVEEEKHVERILKEINKRKEEEKRYSEDIMRIIEMIGTNEDDLGKAVNVLEENGIKAIFRKTDLSVC